RPARRGPADVDALLGRAAGLAGAAGQRPATDPGRGLHELLDAAYSIVAAAAAGQGCDPGHQAQVVPRLTDSVLRPLADALARIGGRTQTPPQGAAAARPPQPGGAVPPQPGVSVPPPPGIAVADGVWERTRTATELRARLGKAGDCPPELAEATAALQGLAGRLVPPGQAEARRADLWQLQAGLPATIQAAHDGPYLVTNVPR